MTEKRLFHGNDRNREQFNSILRDGTLATVLSLDPILLDMLGVPTWLAAIILAIGDALPTDERKQDFRRRLVDDTLPLVLGASDEDLHDLREKFALFLLWSTPMPLHGGLWLSIYNTVLSLRVGALTLPERPSYWRASLENEIRAAISTAVLDAFEENPLPQEYGNLLRNLLPWELSANNLYSAFASLVVIYPVIDSPFNEGDIAVQAAERFVAYLELV